MSKTRKSIKSVVQKTRVRLTVKRGKKERVYKSVKVLKRQCANKRRRKLKGKEEESLEEKENKN